MNPLPRHGRHRPWLLLALLVALSPLASALVVNGVTCDKTETIGSVTTCLTQATLDGQPSGSISRKRARPSIWTGTGSPI